MKADLTRNTFDPHKQFTRVLQQQGRVQLDSDWNEQVAILLHYMQTLAADIIGPHGGPIAELGFDITLDQNDLVISPGRYYVDGILCENHERLDEQGNPVDVTYRTQPHYPLPEEGDHLPEPPFLVYLDVWEHHVTAVEDPDIREVALGGPDTATRAKVVWQVRIEGVTDEPDIGDAARNEAREAADAVVKAARDAAEERDATAHSVADAAERAASKQGTVGSPAREAAEAVARAAREAAGRDATPDDVVAAAEEAAKRAAENESDVDDKLDCESIEAYWHEWVERWQPTNRGMLKARGRENLDEDADPCIVSPEARYRGAENQLYRVEIHRSGNAVRREDDSDTVPRRETMEDARETDTNVGVATFKWSRDNGSVTFPIRDLEGSVVTLESLGRDDHLGLKVGDLVEIVDEDYVLQGRAEPLLRVEEVDPTSVRVTLSADPFSGVGRDQTKHPLLRRWDHRAGESHNGASSYDTLLLREDTWLTLEDGVQIYFESASDQQEQNVYRTGDYWLIPARTATGDVEWPGDVGQPETRPPHGIDHHYAPLAIVANGTPEDCRCAFEPRRTCPVPPD